MKNSIYHSKAVYNCLMQLNLCLVFPQWIIKHILAVLLSVFTCGYKGKQDYGHQAVAAMPSCNGIVLNYAVAMYDKSTPKIEIVEKIAEELPVPPVTSYFLCDSWYTSKDLIKAFPKRGFYTVGALRANRPIYPRGIKCSISKFSLYLRKADKDVSLVTVGSRKYYVYRYGGKLNGIDDAAVLVSFPADAFHNPKALRAFICTDVSLCTQGILDTYVARWPIEVYFRQTKNNLAFDKYQIRSSKGIRRYWFLMSLAHFVCCTATAGEEGGPFGKFEEGYAFFSRKIQEERIEYFYQCGARNVPLGEVLALAG